jgi:hypothetical protein
MSIGKVTLTCSDPAGPCGAPLCDKCNPLRAFTNGTDTVIARHLEDVRAVLVELGMSVEAAAAMLDEHWSEKSADQVVGIVDDAGVETKKTVAEWIAERGRGFLCSTDF